MGIMDPGAGDGPLLLDGKITIIIRVLGGQPMMAGIMNSQRLKKERRKTYGLRPEVIKRIIRRCKIPRKWLGEI